MGDVAARQPARRLSAGAVALGVGVGGLVDGIVLHQLLQWHHLVTARTTDSTLSGLETNTFWDGVFHAGMVAIALAGLTLILRDGRRRRAPTGRAVIAGVLVGWGLFNLFDEVAFHALFGLHHIRMVDDYLAYDLGFAAAGAALVAAGVLLEYRRGAVVGWASKRR